MAKLAYLLLCHTAPQAVIDQVARLTAAGDCVALHFDRSAPARDFALIRKALAGNPAVTFARRRIRCGWGEWSLVAATLQCLHAALRAFPDATHLYLISGDCSPIKTAEHIRARLDARDEDLIESVDFHTSGWIRTGLRAERLIYRHWFNERRQPRLFYGALDLQRRLGLARSMPRGLEMRIGSQWWCLRRTTAEAVLALCARRPELIRFFRTTWIPDECFFQTLVHHLVPRSQIAGRAPTFHIFSDYGLPVTFHADHHDLLLGQDHLFARKIASAALKARLGALYAATGQSFAPAADAARLYALQAGQGRRGHRTPPRAWEEGTSLGRD
ncbi:MAG: hypothetical protein RIT14_2946, partial [Pseudomonadota bacterium]